AVRLKKRRFAGASYACRIYTGASASLCPDSGSQALESLQQYREWQRTPFPVLLPALVAPRRLPPLFSLQHIKINRKKVAEAAEQDEQVENFMEAEVFGRQEIGLYSIDDSTHCIGNPSCNEQQQA